MVSMATILAFHAHPGDEVLLTGGTLARLAAEGNRVVVAVATDGVMGEAAGAGTARRLQELRASASVLGVARIVHLGVLEATLPRELIVPVFNLMRLLRLVVRYDPRVIRAAYTPRSAITHRVDVRRFAPQKGAALAAHRSYVRRPGRTARMGRAMLALPAPIFGLLFGREWFVEPGTATTTISGDILRAVPYRSSGGRCT